MTALAQTLKTRIVFEPPVFHPFLGRVAPLVALTAAAAVVPGGLHIAGAAIADAYLRVSVFVAATIIVLFAAEGVFRADLGQALVRHQTWQVPAVIVAYGAYALGW